MSDRSTLLLEHHLKELKLPSLSLSRVIRTVVSTIIRTP